MRLDQMKGSSNLNSIWWYKQVCSDDTLSELLLCAPRLQVEVHGMQSQHMQAYASHQQDSVVGPIKPQSQHIQGQ